jgi:O-antigen ligase
MDADMNTPAASIAGPARKLPFYAGLLPAVIGVLIAALLVTPFWFVVVAGGVTLITALAASAILPWVIFLLPVGPVVSTGYVIRDVATAARILIFLGFLIKFSLNGGRWRNWVLRDRFNYIAWAWALVAVASVALSGTFSHYAGRALFVLAGYLSMYFLVTISVKKESQMTALMTALLWSTLLVSLIGIYQWVISDYGGLATALYSPAESNLKWDGRVPSLLYYSNSLAGYLNLVLPIAIAIWIVRPNKKLRRLALANLFLGGMALILTESRGGLVALGAVALVGVWCFLRRPAARLAAFTALLAIVLVALPLMVSFSEHFAEIEESNALARLELWAAAWSMFRSSPVLGVGYGNFRELYAPLLEVDWIPEGAYDAHNIYLQALSETGVIGFAVFVFLFAWAMRMAWRQLRIPQKPLDKIIGFAALGACISVLVHGLVDYLFQTSPQFGSLFWVILGMLALNERWRASACSDKARATLLHVSS